MLNQYYSLIFFLILNAFGVANNDYIPLLIELFSYRCPDILMKALLVVFPSVKSVIHADFSIFV